MRRSRDSDLHRFAFVGDYPPRKCGIATFTSDLRRAIAKTSRSAETLVIPVNDTDEGYPYPSEVWFEIIEKELDSYRRAAEFLNLNDVSVVCLQHEYGLFGGPAGVHVLTLLRELRMPVVTTLHTILKEPSDEQRLVMNGLIEYSDVLVALSQRGAEFLRDIYAVPEKKIKHIPHGILDVAFVDPSFHKDKFGVEGRNVLLTFGLIGPGKGIEYAIQALPKILEHHPNTVYVILGATHPNLKREQGEMYRLQLQRLASDLGVKSSVIFHNRFVSNDELKEFLGAADIYLTPYLNEAQICSGTLAYAVGSGKAVVSTPYWHAEELLADGRGVLVSFKDSNALANAVVELLSNPVRQDAMRKKAYLFTREMIWSKVAKSYLTTFHTIRDELTRQPKPVLFPDTLDKQPVDLPLFRLGHLMRLTDDTGVLQHAIYCIPNYAEGYTTDDNARALILTVLLEELMDSASAPLPSLSRRYMSFLQYAFNSERRRFRNFLAYDHRSWLEDVGSEDSHGRALWALGTLVGRSPHASIRDWAGQLFQVALPTVCEFTSPRSWAFTLLGMTEYLRVFSGDRIAENMQEELAGKLRSIYQLSRTPDWCWFESNVTYSNARLPQALLVSGRSLNNDEMINIALEALAWLSELQTAADGHFVPIGSNGFYHRGKERARFDQQPVEAHAMVSASLEAHRYTGDDQWRDEAQRAFDWFVGRNDLGVPLYDPSLGGCHDGLHPHGVNRNMGAESTIAFLLSLAEMRLAKHELDPAVARASKQPRMKEPAAV